MDLTFQMLSKQQTQNPGTKAPTVAKESLGWTKKVKAWLLPWAVLFEEQKKVVPVSILPIQVLSLTD